MLQTQTVTVELGPRSYDVLVGAGTIAGLGRTADALGKVQQVVVISDSKVTGLYGRQAMHSLASAGVRATLLEFPAGEENKNLATVSKLFDQIFAITPPVDRNCVIVALGGGVPGDVAGMVAATALRGIRWLQCPTTLLADVDASVGGKTGVDHDAGKNLIGAFHQPSGVVIDVRTLKTLPPEQLKSGLAECVKHAVIRDGELLDAIETNSKALLACDENLLVELISRNVAIKAAVVSADELESGERAHLNFGHTIGHGIEAFLGYGRITHGQAVALGMIAACRIAEDRHLIAPSLRERLVSVLGNLGLAVNWPGLDVDHIYQIMQHDKKARAGKVRFVLPTALGKVGVFDDVEQAQTREAIASLQ